MQRSYGFTLIELAIVLLIVGLLLAGLLGPLSARVEQQERQKTQAMLEDIKEALYGFAVVHGRLPCPDVNNDGLEDPEGGGTGCSRPPVTREFPWVTLPWATLGVPQYDAWGRNFAYRVTGTFADAPANPEPPCPPPPPDPPATVGVSFKLCSVGDIEIIDADGRKIATGIPAIVLSYGSNGDVPPTKSIFETQNWDGETPFVLKTFSREPAKEFDDLLVWISPKILANRMITAGRLP